MPDTIIQCYQCNKKIRDQHEHVLQLLCGDCEPPEAEGHTVTYYDGYHRVPLERHKAGVFLNGWVYDSEDRNTGEIAISVRQPGQFGLSRDSVAVLDDHGIRWWHRRLAEYVECLDKEELPQHPQCAYDNIPLVTEASALADLRAELSGGYSREIAAETVTAAKFWISWMIRELYQEGDLFTVTAGGFQDSDIHMELTLGPHSAVIQLILDSSEPPGRQIHLRVFNYTARESPALNLHFSMSRADESAIQTLLRKAHAEFVEALNPQERNDA